mmetsp:Transcript_7015/g.25387  ORF Transcript_7015/g.25387 Transcript_7015/m.25387 type:complete len:232 (-) Transcript_7015:1087-1782(-)
MQTLMMMIKCHLLAKNDVMVPVPLLPLPLADEVGFFGAAGRVKALLYSSWISRGIALRTSSSITPISALGRLHASWSLLADLKGDGGAVLLLLGSNPEAASGAPRSKFDAAMLIRVTSAADLPNAFLSRSRAASSTAIHPPACDGYGDENRRLDLSSLVRTVSVRVLGRLLCSAESESTRVTRWDESLPRMAGGRGTPFSSAIPLKLSSTDTTLGGPLGTTGELSIPQAQA